ncbi:hypothetical protein AtNW77_Chr1g0000511 [Arabidopsis thaliana]
MFARTGLLFLLKLLDQNPTVLCPSTLEPVAEILGHQILSPKLPDWIASTQKLTRRLR